MSLAPQPLGSDHFLYKIKGVPLTGRVFFASQLNESLHDHVESLLLPLKSLFLS